MKLVVLAIAFLSTPLWAASTCDVKEIYVTACVSRYCSGRINNPENPEYGLDEPDVRSSGDELYVNGRRVSVLQRIAGKGDFHGIRIKKDRAITLQTSTMQNELLLGTIRSETDLGGVYVQKIRYDIDVDPSLKLCLHWNHPWPYPGIGYADHGGDIGELPYLTLVENDVSRLDVKSARHGTRLLRLKDRVKYARRHGNWEFQFRLVDHFGQRNTD